MRPLAELRVAWDSAPRPAVALEDAIETGALTELRRRFARAEQQEQWLAHRGRYSRAALEAGPVLDRLRELAESIAGTALVARSAEARRFDAGGYALLEDDDGEPGFELCLDFSEHGGARSALVYCAGRRPYFAMPQQPGLAALVHRDADTRRFMPYVQRFTNAPVARVELLLVRLSHTPASRAGDFPAG